jgi:predicted site-specific integrase-resolvase
MAKATDKRNHNEWVSEEEACKLLGIKKITIQNYVYTGRIPESMISRGIRNNKFYHVPSLMGLNQN